MYGSRLLMGYGVDEGITNDMGTLKCAGGMAEGGRGGGGH